jgi:RNA polymerase sigma factor (TIGR02999 family)
VREAYARLVDVRTVDWQDRAHSFAVSSTIMRRILVDAARARASAKRGGHLHRVQETTVWTLDALPATGTDRAADICALDDALDALAKQEPRRARVIELRYFGGLGVEETAEALGVSPQTVLRDWKLARAWLAVELRKASGP